MAKHDPVQFLQSVLSTAARMVESAGFKGCTISIAAGDTLPTAFENLPVAGVHEVEDERRTFYELTPEARVLVRRKK